MTARYRTSLAEKGARLGQRFADLVRQWEPLFKRLTRSRLREADLGSALCADLFYVLSKLSQPYGSRPSEALVDLTLPILASLKPDAFGAYEAWDLQDAVSEADFEPLPAEVPSTCMLFASKGEKQAADDCASAFLGVFSTLRGSERSTHEREIAEHFVTAITLLMQIEHSSDQRRADCALLGVSEQHDSDELRGAYRKKVQAWHPDRLDGMAAELRGMATEQMSGINAAYERLQHGDYPDRSYTPSQQSDNLITRADRSSQGTDSDWTVDQEDVLATQAQTPDRPVSRVIFIASAAIVFVLVIAAIFVGLASKSGEPTPTSQDRGAQDILAYRTKPSPLAGPNVNGIDGATTIQSGTPVDENTRMQVSSVLQKWASAMASNDVDEMLPFYADHLDRYFLQRNIDRSAVRESKEKWLATGNRMTAFEVRSPVLENGPGGQVVVHFNKQVSDVGANAAPVSTNRLIRSELRLAKSSDDWQIVSERDFK